MSLVIEPHSVRNARAAVFHWCNFLYAFYYLGQRRNAVLVQHDVRLN
jgi:hypothetical protein